MSYRCLLHQIFWGGNTKQRFNSILVGWFNYYRMTNLNRQVRRVSNLVWYIIYDRARAHVLNRNDIPNKEKITRNKIRKYIAKNYMVRRKSLKGTATHTTFTGLRKYQSGKVTAQLLINISYRKLKRRYSYRKGLNVCYFKDFMELQKISLFNRPPTISQKVLTKSGGLCENYQRSVIDGTTGCEIYHKLPRMFGGKNTTSNLIPL